MLPLNHALTQLIVFRCHLLLLVACLAASWGVQAQPAPTNSPAPAAASAPADPAAKPLTLNEVIGRVLEHNESIQIRLLESEVARRQHKAEKGIFEPAVVGSYEYLHSERPLTKELRANLSAGLFSPFQSQVYNQRNQLYNGGLEFLSPIGSRFRLGYELRNLNNNLSTGSGSEYLSTIGATLTQPLLKGFGLAATMVRIRLAAIASDIAYQEYRQQLMLMISRAEAAYWDLYLTQEQERISGESVTLADRVLKDNKARLDVGKSSELEVLESEAGYSLRQTRLNDARQKHSEAVNALYTLFSGGGKDPNQAILATDHPVAKDVRLDYFESYKNAFDKNPDYKIRQSQAMAEGVRLAYAKNQRLPQLDLKASYGLSGLDGNFGGSFDHLDDTPSYSVGGELRIPVTGGIRERNELAAAKLNQKKALVSLKEIEVQIGNALDTAILKVKNLRETVKSYASVTDFHQRLLETQLARLEVGKVDSRTVFETEEKLFQARIAGLDALIQYQKSLLELELVQGSTLDSRGFDLSKRELEARTQDLLHSDKFSGPEFEQIQKEIRSDYEKSRAADSTSAFESSAPPSSPASDGSDPAERARRVLRERIQQPK